MVFLPRDFLFLSLNTAGYMTFCELHRSCISPLIMINCLLACLAGWLGGLACIPISRIIFRLCIFSLARSLHFEMTLALSLRTLSTFGGYQFSFLTIVGCDAFLQRWQPVLGRQRSGHSSFGTTPTSRIDSTVVVVICFQFKVHHLRFNMTRSLGSFEFGQCIFFGITDQSIDTPNTHSHLQGRIGTQPGRFNGVNDGKSVCPMDGFVGHGQSH